MIDRIQSGIPGLDHLLDGGIPKGNVIVLAGRSGTGKSIFGAQFLYFGSSTKGEKTLFITFSEDKQRLVRDMKRFGFDFEEMESKGLIRVINIPLSSTGQQNKIADDIANTFSEFKPTRAVLDPFSAITVPMNASKSEIQTFVHSLLNKIASANIDCTIFLITQVSANADQLGAGVEEYIADGIIVLYYLMRGKAKIKAIEIRKMRGTKHSNQAVLLEITENGIVIDPDIELTS